MKFIMTNKCNQKKSKENTFCIILAYLLSSNLNKKYINCSTPVYLKNVILLEGQMIILSIIL